MVVAILLLAVFLFVSYRISPKESQSDAHVHGAGQVGLIAAVALFGVDYFTSYFYATGEMMHALPADLKPYAYYAVFVIILANIVFGGLYMYALGVFSDGGGAFTASMRHLGASVSLVVAVVLIQDYIFTIVVSTLSGVDQLLSITNSYAIEWYWHFLIGAALVAITWAITIRGRGESAQIVFTGLGVFVLMTVTMAIGLWVSRDTVPAFAHEVIQPEVGGLWSAIFHMIAASMKGLVALTGLEAISNGLQFVIDEDPPFVKWGRKHFAKLEKIWHFYSGKTGIGRTVQSSFIIYGAVTTLLLTFFSIHYNVFDGTDGRSLVGNLAYIGFVMSNFPGGSILYWAYQILAVLLLAFASLTAYQDLQAMAWRNVAIGEIPETVVYRNPKGTFTRPVTAAAIAAIIIQLLVRGKTSAAVPYYGVGVFLPISAMALAMRQHVLHNATGRARTWGLIGTTSATFLSFFIFIGQITSKWHEGGWVVLISLGVLIIMAHLLLISPYGYRTPVDIHRIIREKSRIEGKMGNIVEWQSIKFQEYRFQILILVSHFWELFGVRRPVRYERPLDPGSFENIRTEEDSSLLNQYLESLPKKTPEVGGHGKETTSDE